MTYIFGMDWQTWSGQQQTLAEKLKEIEKLNKHVAIQLELQRAFGLRMKEAALLKPHMADRGSYLAVNWGTKGGRDRVVRIQTDTHAHDAARQEIVEVAGHSRESIAGAYVGK